MRYAETARGVIDAGVRLGGSTGRRREAATWALSALRAAMPRMGFNLCWLAARGVEPSVVRERLGLAATGEYEEFHESDFDGIAIDGGWYVVVARSIGFVDELELELVSAGAEVIACMLCSTVMVSFAESWREGERVWRVEHPERGGGRYRLLEEGALPNRYASIRERAIWQQEEAKRLNERVDYIIDVPLDLAHAVTGFRHDRLEQPGAAGDTPWEILERSRRS